MTRGMLPVTLGFVLGCGGGGSGGVLIPPGGGGAGGSSSCPLACLASLAELAATCPATGTCTKQLVSDTAGNICYGNGVKMHAAATSTSPDDSTITVDVKRGATPCYALVMSNTATDDTTMTFKNAGGATIATIGVTAAGDTTVTCPGKAATLVDGSLQAACSSELSSADTASGAYVPYCADGTCSY